MKGKWIGKLLSLILVVSMLASQILPVLASETELFPEKTVLADSYDRDLPDIPLDETIQVPVNEDQEDFVSGEGASNPEMLSDHINEETSESTAGDSSESLAEDAKTQEDTSAESDRTWKSEESLAGELEEELVLGGEDSSDHEELFKIEEIEISGMTVNVQYSVKLNCLLELLIYENKNASDDLRSTWPEGKKIKVYLELDSTRSEASFNLGKSKSAVEDYYQVECPVLCEAGEDTANAEQTSIVLPQYYWIRAIIKYNKYVFQTSKSSPKYALGDTLSEEYTDASHSKELKELETLDVDSADPERVLRPDGASNSNFMIFSDSVIMAEGSASSNVLMEMTDEKIVLGNPDETITGLRYKYRPKMALRLPDQDFPILFAIDSISISDGTAVIERDSASFEDFFDYIKIDGVATGENADVDMSDADEGVTYTGRDSADNWSFTTWEQNLNGIIEITGDENRNILLENKEDHISLGNPDETVVGLKKGDKVSYMFAGLEQPLQFVVGDVQISEEAAVIYFQQQTEEHLAGDSSYHGETIFENTFAIDHKILDKEGGSIDLKGNVALSDEIKYSIYKAKNLTDIKVEHSSDTKFFVSFSGEAEAVIKLGKFKIPLYMGLLSLVLHPAVFLSGKAEGTFGVSYKGQSTLHYITGHECQFSTNIDCSLEKDIETSIFFGVGFQSISFNVFDLEIPVADRLMNIKSGLKIFEARLKAGAKITAKIVSPGKDVPIGAHNCKRCIDGDIFGHIEVSASFPIAGKNSQEFERSLSQKIKDFYYSLDEEHREFGWGECPHVRKRQSTEEGGEGNGGTQTTTIPGQMVERTYYDEDGDLCEIKDRHKDEGYCYIDDVLVKWKSYTSSDKGGKTVTVVSGAGDINPENVKTKKARVSNQIIITAKLKGISNFDWIDYWDFEGYAAEYIKEINLPNGLRTIGYYDGDGKEEEKPSYYFDEPPIKQLPDTVEIIGRRISYLLDFSSFYFPKNLLRIEKEAFMMLNDLEKIELPEKLEYIGEDAFYGCEQLKEIVLSDSIQYLGWRAFGGTGITGKIVLGSHLIQDDNAFCNTDVSELVYPDSMLCFGFPTFKEYYKYEHGEYCSNPKLESVTFGTGKGFFPGGVKTVIFSEQVTDIDIDPNKDYSSGKRSLGDVENVIFLGKMNIIENSAFSGLQVLRTVEFRDGIREIGGCAFSGCKNLETVTGIAQKIDEGAFEDCEILKNISFVSDSASIVEGAFVGCTSLVSVTIPSNWDTPKCDVYSFYREKGIFEGCNGIKTVIFEDGRIAIPQYIFKGCEGIESIKFPEGLESIGERAFLGCTSLESLNLPEGLESIGEGAFLGCTSLESLNLPEGLESIGPNAFSECSALTSVTIPDTVLEISYAAFSLCENLKEVNLSEGLKQIGYNAFAYCDKLTSIVVPRSVSEINGYFLYPGTGCTVYGYSGCGLEEYAGISSYTFDYITLAPPKELSTDAYTLRPDGTLIIHQGIDFGAFSPLLCFERRDQYNLWLNPNVKEIVFEDIPGIPVGENDYRKYSIYDLVCYFPNVERISASSDIIGTRKSIIVFVRANLDTEHFIDSWNAVYRNNIMITENPWSSDGFLVVMPELSKELIIENYNYPGQDGGFSLEDEVNAVGATFVARPGNPPVLTPTPTAKPANTLTPTPTAKPVHTLTPTPTTKPSPTVTPKPTATPSPTPAALKANKITATNYTKTANASKAQTFSIAVKRLGSAKLTYKSDNSAIKVESSGKVTIKKNYVGKAIITITAAKTKTYKKTTKKISVTVKPAKPTLVSVTNPASRALKIVWKKNTTGTGYQLQYSTDKKFSSGVKTVKISKNTILNKTITKLTKNKTYYVRIRSYKKVSDKNYISAWSTVKACKIKK